MILQTIIQVIFYFVMIPFTIIIAILTSLFIYWRYFHRFLSYLPNKSIGPNFNDRGEFKEKDQECFLDGRKFQEEERAKISAAKTATTLQNRIVMTKEIDNLLKKVVENLLEYYLLVWYRPLIVYDQPKYQCKSTESLEHFREALRDNLWKLFSCFIDRLYNVNHVTFISQDLMYRLLKHFQNLKTSSSQSPSPLLVNDSDVDVDEHNNSNLKNDDNLADNVQTNKSIGHRKNQPSSSSIQTNFSSTSSNCSGLSSNNQPNQSSIGGGLNDEDERPVASQFLDHLNPFKSLDNIGQPNTASTVNDPNNKILFYPLASHLAGENEEKSLIHALARFILDTLINDSSGYDQDPQRGNKSNGQKLSLIRDSRTLRSFLDDLLSKILYEAIQTITQPTLINCQIIAFLERHFLLKDFVMQQNDANAANGFGGQDADEDDDESDDDDDDENQIMSKKSVFILNEMKQCLVDNNFDHLYELIDKCNNVKLLKHIRLKLIAEILDAAVVSYLDKTIVGTESEKSRQNFQSFFIFQQNDDQLNMEWELQSRKSSNSSSVDYNQRQKKFNFNAKMDLKFKKFRKEKNLKRLVNRLKFAKTICEQKIQFRRRTLASELPDPNNVNNHKVKMFAYDISFKNDLVKSVSLDDSMFANATASGESGSSLSGLPADNRNDHKPRPKHKKIFKFNQIMANEFSREYFRTFLQQSLLQNDSNVNKRSSLMKFRKDVLLIDCTIYMFEFWLTLQLIFQTLLDWLRFSSVSNSSKHHHSLYESFSDAYNLLLIMVADQRFFYTFSQQFLSIPSDLMRSLERFLLGDLELNAMDITKISFQLNNVEECFLFQQNTIKKDQSDVLEKIDLRKHFNVFERLEKILFNCLNDEFYPQFLISNEYDEILLKHFEHGQSSLRQTKPGILMDLTKKLPIEDWYDYWNNETKISQSYMFKMDHRLKVKPVNKILLINGQPQRSGLNSIGDSNDKQFIDLHKNRKMLLNTIEFPFCYMCYLQLVHINRFKLKMTIKRIVEEFAEKRLEPEDMSMNRLIEDLLSNLGKDLTELRQTIHRIKRILLRTFCWLNADFSTVIDQCEFDNYEGLIIRSPFNTAESKILSFVVNLFKPTSSSFSFNQINDSYQTPSSSNNLKFRVNVTALLSKFQYINQQQKNPTLPATVRNELMSNWSYQWSVEISFEQLQTFHNRILIPFNRIIIFLARFRIKSYITTVMDILNDCSNCNSVQNISAGSKQSNENNNDIKILEKFVNKTNHILMEIRRLKRPILNELKRTELPIGKAKYLNKPTLKVAVDSDQSQKTSGMISFKNLLQKEQQSIEVDDDVEEVTESSSLTPKLEIRSASNEQNLLFKRLGSLLNSYFQQIIAQDTIVKSIGFLHLIGYDQTITETDGQQECLRCILYESIFELNQDYGLNHYAQMFMFRMLFDDHYQNQFRNDDADQYWDRLMNQMMEPNSINNNKDGNADPETPTTKRNPADVMLNSKLFFMQARSLLMDRSAVDCFDFTLDSLKCFTICKQTFCPECDRIMIDSRRRMMMQSSATTYHRTNPSLNDGGGKHSKFRLFNLSLDCLDEDHQSTVSSSSNLMDLIGNVGNSFGIGGGNGSSKNILNLGNLFNKQQSCNSKPGSILSTNAGSSNNIPDLLLNGGNFDEPSLFSLFNDENQLIEPLFLLLIEIFELEGGTVTKTLRRTLMFGMRLFFGQTKMMSRPYKQFIQTLFTEKNVFKWMSKVNVYLEDLLKNQQQTQSPSKTSRQHSKESDHASASSSTDPNVALNLPDIDNNEDEYLKYLNDMLGSLETQNDRNQREPDPSSNDGVRIVQATVLKDNQSTEYGDKDENLAVEDYDGDGDDPVLDEEQQQQLIRNRKLQIIAKQMLFVSVPTFLSHLFGQNNIDKGVNKCFDMLQYQKLNKHLVYEFIEAFLLEYFPEFRKISTTPNNDDDPLEP